MDKKELAKAVKIEDLYPHPEELRVIAGKLRGRCPFHDDSTNPNFFIYRSTNTWYCFAEGKGGDAIAFYMKLHNVDFKQALSDMTS